MPDLTNTVQMIRDGRAAEVRPALEALVLQDPANAGVRATLAMAFEAEGLLEESVVAWQAAFTLAPDSASVSEGLRHALRARLLDRYRAEIEATAEQLAQVVRAEGDGPATAGAEPEAPAADDYRHDESSGTSGPVEGAAGRPEGAQGGLQGAEVDLKWKPMDEPFLATASDRPDAHLSPAAETTPGDGDLDELIRELESARIVPDPTVRPVDVKTIEPDVDDVVSETLARIYSNQRFYEEAAAVYEKLAAQQPARAEEFRRKAADIRGRITR